MNKQQEHDAKKCEELQLKGKDMDCLGCSCSVCIAQVPMKVCLGDLKQFISYAYREGVINDKMEDKLLTFSEHYMKSIIS